MTKAAAPDRAFCDFRGTSNVEQRIYCTLKSLIDVFRGSNIVKCSVRKQQKDGRLNETSRIIRACQDGQLKCWD